MQTQELPAAAQEELFYFFCPLQNAGNYRGEFAVRSQLQVLTKGCGAIWREKDLICRWIDSRFLGESLSFDEVENGLVGIRLDCLIGGIHLRGDILLLKEDDGLVREVA